MPTLYSKKSGIPVEVPDSVWSALQHARDDIEEVADAAIDALRAGRAIHDVPVGRSPRIGVRYQFVRRDSEEVLVCSGPLLSHEFKR